MPTPIGRIALALGEELAVPEVFGVYSAERADIVAVPSGKWRGAVLEIDPKLLNAPYPPGTPFMPYAAAKLWQFWVAAAGWAERSKPAALLLGPEPVIATPPRVAGPGEPLEAQVTAPWAGTWINQDQLIDGPAALAHAAIGASEEQRLPSGMAQGGRMETGLLVNSRGR